MVSYKPAEAKDIWVKGDQLALTQRIFNGEDKAPNLTGFTVQQRYIYRYFLYHKSKRTGKPIPVPAYAGRSNQIDKFFTALTKLEERGLIVVDRRASNYKCWTMSSPR